MQEEQDTCRICSGPAEPDQPLFYPCKCSGTIRYIHQNCLKTWLDHSKKTTCDVCKYPYAFTKIYAEGMPERVPMTILTRRLIEQTFSVIVLMLRATLVAVIWLAALPYGTIIIWRLYFNMGEFLAWFISAHPRTSYTPYTGSGGNASRRRVLLEWRNISVTLQLGQNQTNTTGSSGDNDGEFGSIFTRTVSYDIFRGQIIAAFIVLAFLAIFLLREWIQQNARPGVFDDGHEAQHAEAQPPMQPAEVPIAGPEQNHEADGTVEITGVPSSPEGDEHNLDEPADTRDDHPRPSPSVYTEQVAGPSDERTRWDAMSREERSREIERWQRTFRDRAESSHTASKGKERARDQFDDTSPSPFEDPAESSLLLLNAPGQVADRMDSVTGPDDTPLLMEEETKVVQDEDRQSLQQNSSRNTSVESFGHRSSTHSSPSRRRPPLAVSANPGDPRVLGASSSHGPLPSPQVASYHPPELLGAEGEYFGAPPSSLERDADEQVTVAEDDEDFEYVGHDEESNTDEDALNTTNVRRLERYFREPEDHVPSDAEGSEEDEEDEERPALPDHREELDGQPDAEQQAHDADGVADGEIDEERDLNMDDDLDGAMEAVGMRGPVLAVFQNALLMLVLLSLSIGGGVFVPFTTGKTFALLTLEPRRALQIMHLPIRGIRIVTDPTVDLIIFCLRPLLNVAYNRLIFVMSGVGRRARLALGDTASMTVNHWLDQTWRFIRSLSTTESPKEMAANLSRSHSTEGMLNAAMAKVLNYISISGSAPRSEPRKESTFIDFPVFQAAEQHFAVFGRQVRLAFEAAIQIWVTLTEGDGTVEKMFAIALGYALVTFTAALYLSSCNTDNVKSAARLVRNILKQQMIVFKVALFIIVELALFPFGCGVLLDMCTLQLFPEASLRSRLFFCAYAPITSAFFHWILGTMFMYLFATLLSACRDILRRGCMWFIKDPQDPNFHPIRDILDRPTFSQLRKLLLSAVMYAGVIAAGVGSIVAGVMLAMPSALPLRWKMREPLTEVPVDLLFVHLVIPPTLHYFRPGKTLKTAMKSWWRLTAKTLRLTSFLLGGRRPDEEYSYKEWRWSIYSTGIPIGEDEIVKDGEFRRVPATDNVILVGNKSSMVSVDAQGRPLNNAARALILLQDAAAREAGRNPEEDYTIVYIPPNFRARVMSFILLFWVWGATLLVFFTFVPILLGRAVFSFILPYHVHDGYSLAVGFYVAWWAWLLGCLAVRVRMRRMRHQGSRRTRASWLLFLFKRVFLYATKMAWLFFWLGVIIPTLLSVTVELYLVNPLRLLASPTRVPTIHVVESWASGLILAKILIRTQAGAPANALSTAFQAIQRNGWHRPDPIAATRDFILPVASGLVAMILFPPVVTCIAFYLASVTFPDYGLPLNHLLTITYPGLFTAVAVCHVLLGVVTAFSKWSQGIRDREFLVELRLRNLENPRKVGKVVELETDSVEGVEW